MVVRGTVLRPSPVFFCFIDFQGWVYPDISNLPTLGFNRRSSINNPLQLDYWNGKVHFCRVKTYDCIYIKPRIKQIKSSLDYVVVP